MDDSNIFIRYDVYCGMPGFRGFDELYLDSFWDRDDAEDFVETQDSMYDYDIREVEIEL